MIPALLCIIAIPIHDGDSFRCGPEKLRLEKINAPDFTRSPPCRQHNPRFVCDNRLATASRDHLRSLAPVGSAVRYIVVDADRCRAGFQGTDPFHRKVVRAWNGAGVELGTAQLAGGFAIRWSCKR
jgi:hypothetical protein